MIITRTPLRISFVGGGSDLPVFYNKAVGRVISTAINKYVFVTINDKFDGNFRVGYSVTETVAEPHLIQNTRVRAALQYFKIKNGLEIVSVADVPSKGTGLGSSSSFAVGLLAGLSQYLGSDLHKDKKELAEAACDLEINSLKEPIGKQDQYAAVFGGLNMIEFYPDKVVIESIKIPKNNLEEFKNHLLVFYTGVSRSATEQLQTLNNNLMADEKKFLAQKKLTDSVLIFRDKLVGGDFQSLGEILHDGWLLKKQTSNTISNKAIDNLYNVGLKNGAWGGKLLGAGGGGFMLFLAPPRHHKKLITAFSKLRQLPIGFDNHGAKVIYNRYEYQ